ncbi:hypothetical protein CDAR_402831 [Caerostris darwini]|uniref:Uncharacterized protein n=1 Tax=Caerostris darwini TaxID=1538125 RepID=A0AAV4N3G0_9ARAC|nr:hypothetical protein CDAR_402831 [Caerostris darwini]
MQTSGAGSSSAWWKTKLSIQSFSLRASAINILIMTADREKFSRKAWGMGQRWKISDFKTNRIIVGRHSSRFGDGGRHFQARALLLNDWPRRLLHHLELMTTGGSNVPGSPRI